MAENRNLKALPEQEQKMIEQANKAAREFSRYSKEQVDAITLAVKDAALEKSAEFAEQIVEETGMGTVEHKVIKNQVGSEGIYEAYKDRDFVSPKVDREKKLVEFPRPAGVILALIPCTNPVSTVYYKALIALMTRNAVIFCPHPAAKQSTTAAVDLLAKAAEAAGAPAGCIQVVRQPNLELVGLLMESEQINVILATGGPGMVRAAYSSGNPALGVGSANPPNYVDESADLNKAVEDIVISGSFDNNLLCGCISTVIAEDAIADQLKQGMSESGCYFLTDPSEKQTLRNYLYPNGQVNAGTIGKSAQWIAKQAGIEIPEGAVIIAVEDDEISMANPFSREKLYPVLGFYRVNGLDDALEKGHAMIALNGYGHSAAIHSNKPESVMAWAGLEVYRIVTNGANVTMSAGNGGSGLESTFTLGTGFFSRSSIGENTGPQHLVHWTRVTYDLAPEFEMGDVEGALAQQ